MIAVGVLLAIIWIAVTLGLLERAPPVAVTWALVYPVVVAAIAARRLGNGRDIFLHQQKRDRSVADDRELRL